MIGYRASWICGDLWKTVRKEIMLLAIWLLGSIHPLGQTRKAKGCDIAPCPLDLAEFAFFLSAGILPAIANCGRRCLETAV